MRDQELTRWFQDAGRTPLPQGPAEPGLDPRPSPQDVAAWLTRHVTEAALQAGLRILDQDPNWAVSCRAHLLAVEVTLLYWPHGRHYLVRLERVADGGRTVWRRCSPFQALD